MKSLVPAILCGLVVLGFAGCETLERDNGNAGTDNGVAPIPDEDVELDDERAGVIDHAAFAPARLRVHPLTRFVRNDPLSGKSILETRVEFMDQFGHTTKGRGVLRFELYPSVGNTNLDRSGNRRRLGFWTVNISGLSNNLLHYDEVTRTYRFALQLEEGVEMPSRVKVRVTMWRNYRLLEDEFELSIR